MNDDDLNEARSANCVSIIQPVPAKIMYKNYSSCFPMRDATISKRRCVLRVESKFVFFLARTISMIRHLANRKAMSSLFK